MLIRQIFRNRIIHKCGYTQFLFFKPQAISCLRGRVFQNKSYSSLFFLALNNFFKLYFLLLLLLKIIVVLVVRSSPISVLREFKTPVNLPLLLATLCWLVLMLLCAISAVFCVCTMNKNSDDVISNCCSCSHGNRYQK